MQFEKDNSHHFRLNNFTPVSMQSILTVMIFFSSGVVRRWHFSNCSECEILASLWCSVTGFSLSSSSKLLHSNDIPDSRSRTAGLAEVSALTFTPAPIPSRGCQRSPSHRLPYHRGGVSAHLHTGSHTIAGVSALTFTPAPIPAVFVLTLAHRALLSRDALPHPAVQVTLVCKTQASNFTSTKWSAFQFQHGSARKWWNHTPPIGKFKRSSVLRRLSTEIPL